MSDKFVRDGQPLAQAACRRRFDVLDSLGKIAKKGVFERKTSNSTRQDARYRAFEGASAVLTLGGDRSSTIDKMSCQERSLCPKTET